jgi:lipopolysaccharide transport system ATP-binding protein
LLSFGPVKEATAAYLQGVLEEGEQGPWLRSRFSAQDPKIEIASDVKDVARCIGGAVETMDGKASSTLPIHEPFRLSLRYRVLREIDAPLIPNFHFYDEEGRRFFISMPQHPAPRQRGAYTAECVVPPYLMNTGRYMAGMALSSFDINPSVYFDAQYCLRFEVVEPPGVDERRHGFVGVLPGVTRPRLEWRFGVDERHA